MEKLIQKDSRRRVAAPDGEGKRTQKKRRKKPCFVLCTIIEREHSAACDSFLLVDHFFVAAGISSSFQSCCTLSACNSSETHALRETRPSSEEIIFIHWHEKVQCHEVSFRFFHYIFNESGLRFFWIDFCATEKLRVIKTRKKMILNSSN